MANPWVPISTYPSLMAAQSIPEINPQRVQDSWSAASRPRDCRFPKALNIRPKPCPARGVDMNELSGRPLSIGKSRDAAARHFGHINPGSAFKGSRIGRFGGYGRQWYLHVADIYDWERDISNNNCHFPDIRQLATGIRLIIGNELSKSIMAPHGVLDKGKSFKLSDHERAAFLRCKFMAMAYQTTVTAGNKYYMILLLRMPDHVAHIFGARRWSEQQQADLFQDAEDSLNKMLKENCLPGLKQYESVKKAFPFTPGPEWANPYLALEALRVFIREARCSQSEYEDWPMSKCYASRPSAHRTAETARNLWLADLRFALGNNWNIPLRIDNILHSPDVPCTEPWMDGEERSHLDNIELSRADGYQGREDTSQCDSNDTIYPEDSASQIGSRFRSTAGQSKSTSYTSWPSTNLPDRRKATNKASTSLATIAEVPGSTVGSAFPESDHGGNSRTSTSLTSWPATNLPDRGKKSSTVSISSANSAQVLGSTAGNEMFHSGRSETNRTSNSLSSWPPTNLPDYSKITRAGSSSSQKTVSVPGSQVGQGYPTWDLEGKHQLGNKANEV